MAAKKTARKKPAVRKQAVAKKVVAKAKVKVKVKPKASAKARKPAPKAAAAATPAAKKRPHPPVVHWEIHAVDPARQRAFFTDLFGWPIDANNPQNYGMVPSGGADSIGGGIAPTDSGSRVTFYVEVPDINGALAKAESLGAATVMPRQDIGMVILGQFRDPEGNLIGLIESR